MEARHAAAQVIAKVASIEIPLKQWPQLVKSLLSNLSRQDSPDPLKHATLETLGYVFDEVSPEVLVQDAAESNYVFRAVVCGANRSQTSPDLVLASINALLKALDSAHTKLEKRLHPHFIIRFLYESALSQEVKIRQAAFQCLSSIASIHFEVLKPHIHYLFDLTSDAVKGDEGSVALQAIEFWSSICATEIEHPEVVNPQPDWPWPLPGFIELALPHFVPTLLERMLKPQDDQDHVSNISMAAATCLGLVSQKVGVAIVPFVTSFVDAKISDPHWRSREAATFAFGSVLDVPTFVKLAVLDFLLNATKDEKNKDPTASRIFDFLHSPASGSPGNLPRFVAVLLQAINDDVPNVAEEISRALYSLAQGHEDVGASSYLLTPYPSEIMQHLLAAAEHQDEQVSKLRAAAAYDMLNVVVRCSNIADASNIIAHLLSEIIQEIDKTMDIPIILMDGREKQAKLHASLCVFLQVLIQKLRGTYHQ